jgi:hypothetical protein
MKALLDADGPAIPIAYFRDDITITRIAGWMTDHDNQLGLNEPHSCVYQFTSKDSQIRVYGDEDSKTFIIQDIIPDL